MFFQGRGNVYLAARDPVTGVPGPFRTKFCSDTLAIALATTPFSHFNKCGPVDVEDYRGIKDQSGSLNFTTADVSDLIFALGVLGTVNVAGGPGTVTAEALPLNIVAGDDVFLGDLTRHGAITSLVITDDAVPLVLGTDYTLDAPSGKVTFLTSGVGGSPGDPWLAAYGYTDPESVSMFTSPSQEYSMMYEFINKANANKAGRLELYRVRFDPVANLDMQSPELQIMDIKGSVLADLTKSATDPIYGQFGRRIL
jgi:hypothetical protein